ncbi:MAG: DUF4157 domain-containing protein [Leptolyngbyaceae cyanobacterium bins.302]|nr:DUF4157 domain-containing protein [Leptolyngbyaceae cyanobacterium bins.302]
MPSSPMVQAFPESRELDSEVEEPRLERKSFNLYAEGQTPSDPPSWRGIQTKLAIGQPNDPYEQEADRVAEQVMSMAPSATPNIHRQTEMDEAEEVQRKPLVETITPLVQRKEMPEEEEVQTKPLANTLQRATDGSLQAGGNLESRLNSTKGGGSPLPQDIKSFMESRFRNDFSQVRVHTDSKAVQMNRDLNAQAFTHRQDVYFGAGKAPGKDALTAHELTHVVQQTGAVQTKHNLEQPTVQMKCAACEKDDAEVQRSPNISPISNPEIQRWSLFGDDEDKQEAESEGSSSSGGILDWAKEKASGAVDTVTQSGGDAYDWAKEKGGAVVDKVTQTGSDALNWVKEQGGEALDTATEAGSDALDWAKEQGSAVVDTATQAGSDALDWAKEKGGEALDLATDVGGQALDLVSNLGNIQVDWNSTPGKIVKTWASQLDPEVIQNVRSKSPADLYNLITIPGDVQQAAQELAKQTATNAASSAAPTSSASGAIQMQALPAPVSAPGPVSGVYPIGTAPVSGPSPPLTSGPSPAPGGGLGLLGPIGVAIIIFFAILLTPSNIFDDGKSENEYLEEARQKQYQEAIKLVDEIVALSNIGGTSKVPVKPADLSQSDSDLWDECKAKHDEYDVTKKTVGNIGTKMKAIGKDIPKLTVDQIKALCALIDSLTH